MGFSNLFGIFKKNVANAGEAFEDAIINFDPDTASEVDIDKMQHALDELLREVATQDIEYIREQKEADEIVVLYNKRIEAIEHVQTQLDNPEIDEGRKQALESALDKGLCSLEEMEPDVEREKQEAVDAKELLDDLSQQAKDLSILMKDYRKQVTAAKTAVKKNEAEAERSKRQADKAAVASGIKQKTQKFGKAVEAMNKKAEESKVTASAAKMKEKLLKPVETADDAIMKEAMNAVSGKSTGSARDRLSRLKKK